MKKNKTIFLKTFRPVLTILLIVIGTYTLFIHHYVLKNLRSSAVRIYEEQMINKKNDIESHMLDQWSAMNDSVGQLTEKIEQIVDSNGYILEDIKKDAELNQMILKNMTDDIINTLKTSGATEIFLILDGRGSPQDYKMKAGIYIRNSEPGTYKSNNSNLLFERGIPSISKKWQLPLDSFWQPNFLLDDEDNIANSYYFKPLKAAKQSDKTDFREFGYWSFGHIVDKMDIGILSYSVPLIASDGTVFGVIGLGVNEATFMKHYGHEEIGKNVSRAYVLANTLDDRYFVPYIIKGRSYSKTSVLGNIIQLEYPDHDGLYCNTIKAPNNVHICMNRQDIHLYSPNSPFENEKWALIGIQRSDELFVEYNTSKRIVQVILLISTIVFTLSVFWVSRFISVPIQHMINRLRKSNPNRPIRLKKTSITEIDELVDSIENLSVRVAAAYSKISTVIQMSGAGIAVFEYKEKENLVFCSHGFYELMNWNDIVASNEYVNGTIFALRMKEFLSGDTVEEEKIKEILSQDGSKRWIKIKIHKEEDVLLGVVTDITGDVLEKQKIEYERDHDILTSLLNRRAFEDKLNSLSRKPRELKQGAMLMWDLDNLKYVNDTYGHNMGDEYLIAFADSLREFNNKHVLSARRSGDEFITIIHGFDTVKEIESIVDDMWNAAQNKEIILQDQRRYKIRFSMGRAWYPKDAVDFDTLFLYADFAMYTVKNSRKGTRADFDQETYQEKRILLQGHEAFNNLLEQQLVKYMLQPIVRTSDGSIFGYEMLMRSELEIFKSPKDILKIAHSQSKLYDIEVMTWFVAMKTFVSKIKEGACQRDSKVFINSIANQIMNEDIMEQFMDTYKEYLPNIVCEVTEDEKEHEWMTAEKVRNIRNWGGLVAVDDYGCGYSSESALLSISPDVVKIDISIVRGIHQDDDRKRLVANLVLYAKERGIMVLGEGVETKEEMETLISLGVHFLQGYYVAAPSYEGKSPEPEVCEEIKNYSKKFNSPNN